MKKIPIGAALARRRWAKATEADRDQPRRAGLLGGRPPSCVCGTCANCKRRAKYAKKAA